ncbi:MAG: damage-control phosphatase ARMT1 family protein [Anaerolineae bacterium]
MKTYLDCYPCFVRQAIDAARMAGAGEDEQKEVLLAALRLLEGLDANVSPPEIGHRIHGLVRERLGAGDPYRDAKHRCTHQALALLPRLRALLQAAEDPFACAVRLAIAGNIIDLGVSNAFTEAFDLWEDVLRVLAAPLAVDHIELLREAVAGACHILYLGDNAGETVFDRLLIERLPAHVTYVAKSSPILNDATEEDALAAGLGEVCTVMGNGSNAPGSVLALCNAAFCTRLAEADVVISKGQANYETLSEARVSPFFLLQVKCPVIASDLALPLGSLVVKSAAASRSS